MQKKIFYKCIQENSLQTYVDFEKKKNGLPTKLDFHNTEA